MDLNNALQALLDGKRVRGLDWDGGKYLEMMDGQIVDEAGKPYNIMAAKVEGWEIWTEPSKKEEVISKADALAALFAGKRVRAVDWDSDALYVKDNQVLINGSKPYNIMEAKEDRWVIVEDEPAGAPTKEIAELKEMLQQLIDAKEVAPDQKDSATAPKDGRDTQAQAVAAETLNALYGASTPAEVLEKFGQQLNAATNTRDVTLTVCEFIPFAWIGGKTMATAKTYYTKLRNVARTVENEQYRELALALCLPPQSLYEAIQQKTDTAKKEKIRDEESFEIEAMHEILEKLSGLIEGGDEAIKSVKTRQQTLERAKAYVYATYLALVTGRRMIEILQTLRIEKRGDEYFFCGIAKDRSEEDKCIKAYLVEGDFVTISKLLEYVQEHIRETGGEGMSPTKINSKFNNPFNGAFKRLTGTGYTFKDARDIYAELLWDKMGEGDSWVDKRDFRAKVLGHEYDASLSTPEHYMGLKGVRNAK